MLMSSASLTDRLSTRPSASPVPRSVPDFSQGRSRNGTPRPRQASCNNRHWVPVDYALAACYALHMVCPSTTCASCGQPRPHLKRCPECGRGYCNPCGHVRVTCSECGAYLRTVVLDSPCLAPLRANAKTRRPVAAKGSR